MNKLYAVVLGGAHAGNRLGEDHETVFVIAKTTTEAAKKAKAKWSGLNKRKIHVDAFKIIDVVDGYSILLKKS